MRTVPILAAVLLAGCSPVYVLKSASGHLGFVSRARSIESLLKDPATDPETRKKLELVAAVREFSFQEMGLERSGDYSRVSRLKGPFVTTMVMASDKAAFKAHEWWFPFIGRMPYKAHFSRKDAEAEAGRLERRGLDVYLTGVAAYNTPLPVADPLAHAQLALAAGDLAELILHELCHGTVFLKDRVDFDEALASFVGEAGAADFLAARFGPESLELSDYRAGLEKSRLYSAEVERLYAELDALY
ncbi:MAG: aminopeptidase, partial [Elusimicrobiota bacterium]